MSRARRSLAAPAASILLCVTAGTSHAQEGSAHRPGRSTVYAPNGMVASSQPLATGAGLAVLQSGGNAVDAAVTMAAVLNVVEPMMTGIGGDMFSLLWLAEEQRLVGLNASGRAGSLATSAALTSKGHDRMPGAGAATVTVPGAMNGWAVLLEQYGSISLAQALTPAIELAKGGFPVSPVIADFWRSSQELLAGDAGAAGTFLTDGKPPQAGDWFQNPDFAETLKLIADQGPKVFYEGALGEQVVARIQELGGFLTKDDLAANKPEWISPMSVAYEGYRIWELPPNGQGIAALEMLRILEAYDLESMGHNSADYLHHLIEAKKLAYADIEQFVGDPDHMSVSPEQLLNDAFIERRRESLDPTRAILRPEPGKALATSETTYLTTADSQGNMVSFINSLAGAFGSGVVVPGTGFALQNRGVGFSLEADRPNTMAPGRRPFHTIIPAFITRTGRDGQMEPWVSMGVIGGFMQPQGHVQVLLNLIEFGMTPQQAIDAARFNHLNGNRVAIESAVPDSVLDVVGALGHELVDPTGVFFGGGQLIMKLPQGWAAASGPRMDGMAAGH